MDKKDVLEKVNKKLYVLDNNLNGLINILSKVDVEVANKVRDIKVSCNSATALIDCKIKEYLEELNGLNSNDDLLDMSDMGLSENGNSIYSDSTINKVSFNNSNPTKMRVTDMFKDDSKSDMANMTVSELYNEYIQNNISYKEFLSKSPDVLAKQKAYNLVVAMIGKIDFNSNITRKGFDIVPHKRKDKYFYIDVASYIYSKDLYLEKLNQAKENCSVNIAERNKIKNINFALSFHDKLVDFYNNNSDMFDSFELDPRSDFDLVLYPFLYLSYSIAKGEYDCKTGFDRERLIKRFIFAILNSNRKDGLFILTENINRTFNNNYVKGFIESTADALRDIHNINPRTDYIVDELKYSLYLPNYDVIYKVRTLRKFSAKLERMIYHMDMSDYNEKNVYFMQDRNSWKGMKRRLGVVLNQDCVYKDYASLSKEYLEDLYNKVKELIEITNIKSLA